MNEFGVGGFNLRLQALLEALALDAETFGERIGQQAALVHFWSNNVTHPTAPMLAAIREQFGVNLNWLVCGDGEMFDREDAKKKTEKGCKPARKSTASEQEHGR